METVYIHLKSYTDQYGIPLLKLTEVATELTCRERPLEDIPNVMEKAKAPIYRALIQNVHPDNKTLKDFSTNLWVIKMDTKHCMNYAS